MGSTISNSAPIAPIVSGVEPAQQSDAERTSDLQRAYREQCRAALGKRDDGRDCDDTEAQRAHARKKTKRNGEPPGAAGGMPAPHAARDRAFALRFGGARLGEARSGANARDARVGAGAEADIEADIEAGIEAGVGVGTDAHAAGGARTRGEIAARGGATMRGHAPASGAVRATSERAPAAATADAHAPQAAAESAPPSVPMPAAHAAPRTSGGSARDIAAAACGACASAVGSGGCAFASRADGGGPGGGRRRVALAGVARRARAGLGDGRRIGHVGHVVDTTPDGRRFAGRCARTRRRRRFEPCGRRVARRLAARRSTAGVAARRRARGARARPVARRTPTRAGRRGAGGRARCPGNARHPGALQLQFVGRAARGRAALRCGRRAARRQRAAEPRPRAARDGARRRSAVARMDGRIRSVACG
ncbi:BsaU protein [Burkholderia pseudomallei]|nr:BsaU protein [Burkholderia pseudomallei]